MREEIPFVIFLPLFIVVTAAVLYQRRHEIAVWLGLKRGE